LFFLADVILKHSNAIDKAVEVSSNTIAAADRAQESFPKAQHVIHRFTSHAVVGCVHMRCMLALNSG
jgi:hypothetical protein